ncbi:hypothetical protein H7J87_22830 [Mycolicibacterium wolinskyi]|uniref:Uncharacterized protein n=1 Tax=Mycolicibacterium wolinskyi TaxID=59750 RepID=A0A1X2FIZ9_9MYCO|nr:MULTISPECIES: hypothetical protein [Mycolicibacterium]MCV7288161.1 hypothetical protein [Mycolicibacterium wolinskyi]MCV7296886.1 hypothetical protein [Mycolicibacterium goodii]ORX18402.1 hypothetical protein AWC31_13920 [Mycolicibacterium wolinskyi]
MQPIAEPLNLDFAGRLPGFGPGFMAHGPASMAARLAPLTQQAGVGAVLTSRNAAAAKTAIRAIRAVNADASVLADAHRYSGRNRSIGAAGMDPGWINMQFQAGCQWALTDSGYIPAADPAALAAVLGFAAGTDQVITALPLALSWLTDDRGALLDAITAAGRPVAVMLEHKNDPLGSEAAVAGLIEVLRADVAVLLLLSDISTLGALAHGAAAVSVGTQARYRHIYPRPAPGDEDGGFTPPPSAFVPALMSYKHLELIADLHTRHPDSTLWHCSCVICAGRTLDWITTAVDAPAAAFEHSVAALAAIAAGLMADPDPATRWQTLCAQAQLRYDEIPTPSGRPRRYPPALRAWVRATPQPIHR